MHGAALAARQTASTSGQFRHHAVRIHAASQHMAMITVTRDYLVTFPDGHLHTGDHGFLTDIKMTKTADEAHAVKLTGLLLEATDQKHHAIGIHLLIASEFYRLWRGTCAAMAGS